MNKALVAKTDLDGVSNNQRDQPAYAPITIYHKAQSTDSTPMTQNSKHPRQEHITNTREKKQLVVEHDLDRAFE